MRRLKQAVLAMSLAFSMVGTARAWDVTGSVVCGDTTIGVQGVEVYIGYAGRPDWTFYNTLTNESGWFGVGVPDALTSADVYLLYGGNMTVSYSVAIQPGVPIGPFQLPADWCAPPPPPPPGCPELSQLTEGTFCTKLTDPISECAYLGLEPMGKDDGLSGRTFTSTMNADAALVKAGGCYNLFVGVAVGDVLSAPPEYNKGISHVTYCSCPPQ